MSWNWIEWLGVACNIGYVLLARKRNLWCWPLGLGGAIASAWVYFHSQLFMEHALQWLYAFLAILGWMQWKSADSEENVHVLIIPKRIHIIYFIAAIFGGVILAYINILLGAKQVWLDAFLSSSSVVATWMTTRRYLESWIWWICIDSVSIGLYIYRELWGFVILFLFFTVIAWIAYREWKQWLQSHPISS